jgi:hypothetical protein
MKPEPEQQPLLLQVLVDLSQCLGCQIALCQLKTQKRFWWLLELIELGSVIRPDVWDHPWGSMID